jgi:elongation factor Tu
MNSPADKTPIVIGSALKALEGDVLGSGTQSVEKLVAEMDKYIPMPERLIDGPVPDVDRGRVFDLRAAAR